MFGIGLGRTGIGDEEYFVVHHHRVPRRGFAADLRHGARNDERVDSPFLQARVQIRRARHEGTEAPLDEDHILLGHIQFRPERVTGATGCECLDKASTTFRREEMLKKDRLGADRLSIRRVLHVDHDPARSA
jgi:hypothetical protein